MTKTLADLQRRIEAGDPEAIAAAQRMIAAFSKAMNDWLKLVRPHVNRIIEVMMSDPKVRAAIQKEARKINKGASDG